MNYIRAAIASGIANLHHPLDWDLGHVKDPAVKAKYSQAVNFLTESLRFMHTIGADKTEKLDTVDLFTSHEGLLLEYEEALTRLMDNPIHPPTSAATAAATPANPPCAVAVVLDPLGSAPVLPASAHVSRPRTATDADV